MPTYIVNALGDNSAPDDGNPAHGATSFNDLLNYTPDVLQNGDIVEVTDFGMITEPSSIDMLGAAYTIRPYSGNTGKPIIKMPVTVGTDWQHGFSMGGSGIPVIKGMQFFVDAAAVTLRNSAILYSSGGMILDSCHFYFSNPGSATKACAGIFSTAYDNFAYPENSPVKIMNCIFENIPSFAISPYWLAPHPVGAYNILNCTFVKCVLNPALHDYQGVISTNDNTYTVDIHNCDFYGNGGVDLFVAAYQGSTSIITENNNVFYSFPTPRFNIDNPGAQTVNADPMFVDYAGGNYNLASGSPCKDTGLPVGGALGVPAYDYAGTVRPQGLGVDIGALESVPAPVALIGSGFTPQSLFNQGAVTMQATNVYFGNPVTEGSWRMRTDSSNLVFQRLEYYTGIHDWTTKQIMEGSPYYPGGMTSVTGTITNVDTIGNTIDIDSTQYSATNETLYWRAGVVVTINDLHNDTALAYYYPQDGKLVIASILSPIP